MIILEATHEEHLKDERRLGFDFDGSIWSSIPAGSEWRQDWKITGGLFGSAGQKEHVSIYIVYIMLAYSDVEIMRGLGWYIYIQSKGTKSRWLAPRLRPFFALLDVLYQASISHYSFQVNLCRVMSISYLRTYCYWIAGLGLGQGIA